MYIHLKLLLQVALLGSATAPLLQLILP